MRSDGIAQQACIKGKLIIINLQQTPYDERCSLRIYGNLQNIMQRLGK
jgi:NAD-dependent SIR2 family protein deacetylase